MELQSRGPRFDYIVVGAGSAGCVLANRLTADGKHSVLLIEAGGDDRPFHNLEQFIPATLIHIPVGVVAAMRSPGVTWGFQSEPEPGANGRRFDVIRGRVLGGSSSINGMLYVRGERQDYDRWEQAGCPGWGWDSVSPYFKRAEQQEAARHEWQGIDGPLVVSEPALYPIVERVLDAAVEIQLPRSGGFDGGMQYGGGRTQLNIKNGRRHSAADAYLHPAATRRNLTVVTDTLVAKVLFVDKTAVGVETYRENQRVNYFANKEVILAAGSIGSAPLLERSGIGDPALLRSHGIPVVHDSPEVGENLQDHYFVPVSWRLQPGVKSLNRLAHFPWNVIEVLKYVFTRRGVLGQSAVQLFIYAKSQPNLETADLQLSVVPATIPKIEPGKKMEGDPYPGMTIACCQLRPTSRGHVHITSSDPGRHPRIQHRYLDDPMDQAAQVAGIRLARAIASSPSLSPHIQCELTPGGDVATDQELLEYVRREGSTVYHPVGTLRMGEDSKAPVDSRLRVKGVDRLRVVDASIMPFLTSGNTNAPTIMIAEKASDLIRSNDLLAGT